MTAKLKPPRTISCKDKQLEQQLNYILNDVYGRVGRLEPEVEATKREIQELRAESLVRGLRYDIMSVATPYPAVGDPVHYDSTYGVIRGADRWVNNNVIGLHAGGGVVVSSGMIKIPGLPYGPWNTLYVKTNYGQEVISGSGSYYANFRYSSSQYSVSQSFSNMAGKVICSLTVTAGAVGDPFYEFWFEIRSDSGGLPSSTVLSESYPVHSEHLSPSSSETLTVRMQKPFYVPDNGTYHICVASDETSFSSTDYVRFVMSDDGYSGGYMCVQNSSGTWSADTSHDMNMTIYYDDITGTSSRLSASPYGYHIHPESTIRVGHMVSYSEAWVKIESRPVLLERIALERDITFTGMYGLYTAVKICSLNLPLNEYVYIGFVYSVATANHAYPAVTGISYGGSTSSIVRTYATAPERCFMGSPDIAGSYSYSDTAVKLIVTQTNPSGTTTVHFKGLDIYGI